MTTITPESRQAIEQAGDEPVRLLDPLTNTVYALIREGLYEAYRDDVRAMAPLLDPED